MDVGLYNIIDILSRVLRERRVHLPLYASDVGVIKFTPAVTTGTVRNESSQHPSRDVYRERIDSIMKLMICALYLGDIGGAV